MDFVKKKKLTFMPRIPLEGSIDLTYRCNNRCRHCWLWMPENDPVEKKELTFDEIKGIVDEARAMGCQRWNISGGEPMLRPDFPEIFDYITEKSMGYSLNTNGTLITREIAQLMKRKGSKMVALYGATAEVYDHVTRNPGGFRKVMRGIRYLQKASTGFTVQLIPMQANWHQWDEMVALAKRLSPHWRVGAPWLWLSQDASPQRNREIAEQRLPPEVVVQLDKPDLSYTEWIHDQTANLEIPKPKGDRLFASCIEIRRDFHIDPFGGMSWCSFIKDPELRYNLRKGTFREAWEEFIPSCGDKVCGDQEWLENCAVCDLRSDCRWCAVYAKLETGRYGAPVPYLCEVAKASHHFKSDWEEKHRRYFRIAGITVRVETDLDLTEVIFKDELMTFAVDGPGEDNVTLRHYFEIPDLRNVDLGEELYRKVPWAISRKGDTWFYLGINPMGRFYKIKSNFSSNHQKKLHRLGIFNADHSRGEIYSPPKSENRILEHGFQSLSLFPTDQIWLAPLLADRQAVLLHSSAAIINGKGLVFVGHSGAGKTTTMHLLKQAHVENNLDIQILCDDRNVVRKWSDGWRVHGTWSHGDIAEVSPNSAPLEGIFFLEQSQTNDISEIKDNKDVWKRLLGTMIKPMVTPEWWQNELEILSLLIDQIPCYQMQFCKNHKIIELLLDMV